MTEENLFLRMEGYAKENYVTEAFVYILVNYPKIKNKLLRWIWHNSYNKNIPSIKHFRKLEIKTQSSYDGARIDIEFFNPHGKHLFIETKINAPESKDQIQKYLDLNAGYVIYLTPLGNASPSFSRNKSLFIGHFFWEDIYTLLKKDNQRLKSELISQFLNYLEVNHMGKIEPLTKEELKFGKTAFNFIRKSKNLLEKVKAEIEPYLEDQFGANIHGYKKVNYNSDDEMISWYFKPKKWKKRELYLGINIECYPNNKPSFLFEFGVGKTIFSNKLKSDMRIQKKLKRLSRRGWETQTNHDLNYWKSFYLESGDIETISKKIIKKVKRTVKELICKEIGIINLIEHRM